MWCSLAWSERCSHRLTRHSDPATKVGGPEAGRGCLEKSQSTQGSRSRQRGQPARPLSHQILRDSTPSAGRTHTLDSILGNGPRGLSIPSLCSHSERHTHKITVLSKSNSNLQGGGAGSNV